MILDASVVVELVLRAPHATWIAGTLDGFPRETLRMSWVNVAEASMALARDNPAIGDELEPALMAMGIEFIEADHAVVRVATEARSRFPLNFGDCFAYAHARLREEALLTLDADFLKTDLKSVLHPRRRPA
jgi:ribonuclease VapC